MGRKKKNCQPASWWHMPCKALMQSTTEDVSLRYASDLNLSEDMFKVSSSLICEEKLFTIRLFSIEVIGEEYYESILMSSPPQRSLLRLSRSENSRINYCYTQSMVPVTGTSLLNSSSRWQTSVLSPNVLEKSRLNRATAEKMNELCCCRFYSSSSESVSLNTIV